MKRHFVAAALLALPLLAGCDSTDVTSTPPSDNAAASEEKAAGGDAAADEGSEQESLTKPFGSTFTWDDKLSVTFSKPQPYTPGEYAAGTENFKDFVVMDVTIKNGTSKVYDANMFTASATTGEKESDQVYDGDKIGSPSSKVMPGKSLKFKVAFGVEKGQDFTVVINSMDRFDRADGIYSGKA